jgi:hypothetical protein
MITVTKELAETFYIIILGVGFSVTAKPIDLIDENKWIKGLPGFLLKYLFVLIFSGVVYLSLQMNRNLTPHFLALFLFWILNGKLNYPSHVLFAFIPALIMGKMLTLEYILLAVVGLLVYGMLELLVKRCNNSMVQLILYKSLVRFLVVPFCLGAYLYDFTALIYTVSGLLSMHLVRYLIRVNIIKISEGRKT